MFLGHNLLTVIAHMQAEESFRRRSHPESVPGDVGIQECNFPTSITIIERARSHVVLEVEDEALRSTVNGLRDQSNTGFETQDPSIAVLCIREIEGVTWGDRRRKSEHLSRNIVVLILVARCINTGIPIHERIMIADRK